MNPIFKHPILLFIFSLALFSGCKSEKNEGPQENVEPTIMVIPKPKNVNMLDGNFQFSENTVFVVNNERQKEIAKLLVDKFKWAAGWELKTVNKAPHKNYILFKKNKELPREGYILQVSDGKISIEASTGSGFIYALETIRQLLPPQIESQEQIADVSWSIPNLEIEDEPRFEWRGLMLDVARHFFEKEYILKTIDRLAMLKMNTLQLHLVDDQGWRIEIKAYPKLTEVGAWRADHEDRAWNARPTPTPEEPKTYGGFYTQEDIKEIVAYAASKGITVVPEIEMPAHVMSAIAAYPWLSCTGEQIQVPTGGVWPITTIYCPGKESTFEFLENVLLEVMALFPSQYIHIGGDEATKTEWKTCPHCQKRMEEEGLENVEELQSYFIKRIEKFLSAHGRTLIGWDEILEGGLAPGATVMSWRGIKGGWEASEQGHDVVMTPGSHMYFNFYQGNPNNEPLAFGGYTPLSKVYQFNPVVDSMSVAQKKHVLGGQANLWAEYIATPSLSEYMLFPRLAALAEVVWTPEEKLSWESFSKRIKHMFERFEYLDINYATSAYEVSVEPEMDLKKGILHLGLKTEFPNSEIRYALNDEELSNSSKLYEKPLELTETITVKAAVFEDGKMKGDPFIQTFVFHKAVGKPVSYNPIYHDSYQGAKEVGMVNILRGSKNFHDGQWQAWLVDDMQVTINMQEPTLMHKVTMGSMVNQGSGIYYPVRVEVLLSDDGKNFKSVGVIERPFKINGLTERKDFTITFEEQKAQYVRVKAQNLAHPPSGGDAWLFVDEIVVE